MLVIRNDQMRLLGRAPREAFEASLVEHFTRYYPNECNRAGREQVQQFVRLGIDRAFLHGLSAQREVGLYINLMMMLGSGFDRDPLLPWAAQQLNDSSIADSFDRIRKVFDSALQYLEDCYGPENGQMKRTLIRLRNSKLADAPESDGLRFRTDVCALLKSLAPKKFEVDGEDAVRGTIQEAIFRALSYGMTSSRSRTVFSCLMFLLGVEFDTDPLYPWAAEKLAGTYASEAGRIATLYEAAMEYVAAVLQE